MRTRLQRVTKAAAVVLAMVCVFYAMTAFSSTAFADPATPPPSPSPSPFAGPEPKASPGPPPDVVAPTANLQLALSLDRGAPGTSFTATAKGAHACFVDRSKLAQRVSFESRFGQKYAPVDSDSASATFTVPASAAPGPYAVTASCGAGGKAAGSATFTVTTQPGLLLSPNQGASGSQVRATTRGFDTCRAPQTLSWQWDNGHLQTAADASDASTVAFQVPPGSGSSVPHTVTATCDGVTATAPFTVIAPAVPALKLDRSEGQRGTELTASGTGFACGNDRVALRWDGTSSLADAPPETFSVAVTIPADSPIGQHAVVASCRDHPELTDSQSFTVTTDVVGADEPATLALAPARGAPRDAVNVTGDRFVCNDAGAIELYFGSQLVASPSADAFGHFDTTIKVPSDARAGSLTVRAACDAGSTTATAAFTVVPVATTAPTPTGMPGNPPPPASRWNLGWLLWVIFGVLAAVAYRHWRKPPVPHVSATVSLSSRNPLVATRETPANGERTHALRLQTHADPGIQTLSEVDSDRT